MRYITAALAFLLLAASTPPNLAGTWEGTMDGPTGHIRRIMVITRSHSGYDVTIHSIDETDVPIVTNKVTIDGSSVAMRFDMNTDPWMDYHRLYRAHLNANGTAMNGTWSGSDVPKMTMDYHRVAHATWPIFEPKTTLVPVGSGIDVEALDWGGTGRPVMLLAGLGNTGHDFFKIIPALTAKYHVYSMTRRGFGNSTKPAPTAADYSADRLGDDVLAVMQALHIERPVLIGHSIAGEELSDIGTRFPKEIAALVYLDAGYWYALNTGVKPPDISQPRHGLPPMPAIGKAVLDGGQSFKGPLVVPILAIFAHPHSLAGVPQSAMPAFQKQEADDAKQIAGFQHQLPSAKVVVIPNADHFIYISNTDQVLREINAFIGKLP